MSKRGKFFDRLMSGKSDKNIDFGQLCGLLESLGFTECIVAGIMWSRLLA